MPLRKENARSRVIAYLGFAGAILILITLGFDVIIYRKMNELLFSDLLCQTSLEPDFFPCQNKILFPPWDV